MERVKYIWSDDYVGERHGPVIPEEGDRTKPYSDKYWSKVETLPMSRIREIQLEKLIYLIKFAYENSAFYRKRWDEMKIKPSDIKSLEDIVKLPILKKEDFERDQVEYPPYGTVPTSSPNTHFQYYQTSGTTGKPRLYTDTKEDIENGIEVTIRAFYAHGVRPGWRGFYGFPFPPFMGFWHIFYSSAALGCQNVPKGPIPTAGWLKLIMNLAGSAESFLVSTPTYAIRQLEVAKEVGINPHDLKISKIIVSGEPGYGIPATNRLLAEGFNAEVHDQPGSTEHAGPQFFSCESLAKKEEPSDHITADYWLVEVLDPKSLDPVNPDKNGIKSGISCVTALSRFGMPSIRVMLGDYINVIEDTRCECGRTLPIVLGGIKSRGDDMFIVKGVNIYPALIENSVRSIEGLSAEYRIKKIPGNIFVLVEAEKGISKDDYPRLSELLQNDIKDKTTVRVNIEVLEPGSLPREEAKTKRVIKE
jgi:phenylacetate-CoA ligase